MTSKIQIANYGGNIFVEYPSTEWHDGAILKTYNGADDKIIARAKRFAQNYINKFLNGKGEIVFINC